MAGFERVIDVRALIVDTTGAAASIGGGTQQTEDTAHSSGAIGTLAIAVRNDAGVALAGTDGDYIPLSTDANGALHVTGGGGGTQYAEDAVAASGNTGTVALAVRRDTATSGVSADGDYAALSVDSVGALRVTGGLGYAEDTAHVSADSGTMALVVRTDSPADKSGTDGDYEPLQVAGGLLWTRLRGLQTPNGDSAMDDTNDALRVNVVAAASSANYTDDAAFTVATDKVVAFGAMADETATDSVTEGDVGALRMSLDRRLLVAMTGTPLVERVSNTDGASTALTVFGATASNYNYITTIIVHNAHASTNGFVDIRDGTGGTVLATFPAPAVGGTAISFPVPLKQTTVNTALAFDVSAAITTVYLTFIGFKCTA